MPIRITGLNSGLDTEAIISALISSYDYKTKKYEKAQTKLSWKQDAWKELNTKIYSLYTTVGNLRLSSAYSLKSTTVSDNTKITVSAGTNSVNGNYSVQVTKLAKAGYLTGGQLAKGTASTTTLADLGYTGADGKISVSIGGSTTDIEVTKDSTIQDVVNRMKEAGVNASYDETNRRIYVSAKKTGEENDFALSGADAAGTEMLTKLGLNVESSANTAEYVDLASYKSLDTDGDGVVSAAEVEAVVDAKLEAESRIAELSTTNANYTKALEYMNASKAINAVGVDKDAEEFAFLKSLATTDELDKKYVKENKIYTFDKEKNGYCHGDDFISKEDMDADLASENPTFVKASEKLDELAESYGLITDENREGLETFKQNLGTVVAVAGAAESDTELAGFVAETDAILEGTGAETAEELTARYESAIGDNKTEISQNKAIVDANARITSTMSDEAAAAFAKKVNYAASMVSFDADGNATVNQTFSAGATRVNGSSATIYVNGAEYTSDSNTFSINGMTITANGVTGTVYDPTETSAVNTTVNTDVQGIYDKIKDFLSQYNALMNEMCALYNADSSKGYEPLTDEERDALSDAEVEKWEKKIKDSLLRRDDTLSGIISTMSNAMAKSVKINGEDVYLSDFGIRTLGYFNAPKNQQNSLHIDGDEDDSATSGKADKLMAAITEDPDKVLEFMQGMAKNLYDAVDKKMKGTTLKTTYTVYNDKEMASEYSDYTSLIRKWQERLEKEEDYYYKKFAAMEKALSKLNSQTSNLTGLFG